MKLAVVGRTLAALALTCCTNLAAQSSVPAAGSPPVSRVDLPSDPGAPGRFKLKVDVDLVLVEATVRDERGAIVDNLKREDFRLLEDGVEQEIRYFSRDELPLAVALVVDRSGSAGPVLKELRRAAYTTLSLLKPDDRMALFDFAARPEQLDGLTADRQRIADGIAQIHGGGGTVITDALFEATAYLARAAPRCRHALVLVSDNENTLRGYTNESQVIRQALETETVIYSIKIEEGRRPRQMYVLLPIFRDVSVAKIASATGGEVIDAKDSKAVQSAMATVISRLKLRYNLGYHSTSRRRDGSFRQIEIRVSDPSNNSLAKSTVYARRGYYAPRETAAAYATQTQGAR